MEKVRDVLVILSPVSQLRLNGIARYAKERGWHLMVQDRIRYGAVEWVADGVIATIREGSPITDAVREYRRRGVPVVDLTDETPQMKTVRVTSDNVRIGRIAAEHFEEHHFAKRAWFSSGWTNVHRLRYAGLTEKRPALKWIGSAPIEKASKPIAVLTYDETDAALLLRKCLALGISVPEEVSILSIGNDPLLSEMQPIRISSIDQNLERGGYEAAAVLAKLMDGGKSASRLIPPQGIVIRQSTDVIAAENPDVRKAVVFIRNNLSHSIGADQIADALGCSRSKIDKLFAAEIGHSVATEIQRQRISHVKLLLKNTDLPASLIAAKAGFCTPSHLNNAFRRETGLTPRKWRNS